MQHGFIKVASAIPEVRVADTKFNLTAIEKQIALADGMGVEIVVFPELSVTGYSCQDLFTQQLLIENAEHTVMMLLAFTRQIDIISIVGVPILAGQKLLNCAVVIQQGKILGIVPKTHLPNYGEFYEKRWFASAYNLSPTRVNFAGQHVEITPEPKLFQTAAGVKFGIEICEDLWSPTPPSNHLALSDAEIIFNLSATDELIGKHTYLKSLLAQQSARTLAGYVYSSCGFGESTQDVVYGGNAMIYENGKLLAEAERFSLKSQLIVSEIDVEKLRSERRNNTTFRTIRHTQSPNVLNADVSSVQANIVECFPAINPERTFTLTRSINPTPFIPKAEDMATTCSEILNIQVAGLAKRLHHTHCKTAVIGLSGGLDSTLALLVCLQAFDRLGLSRKGILGVTMPGFGTTHRTRSNAHTLMNHLGITTKEISIVPSVTQHLSDIEHSPEQHDATYENAQARERTQILMDLSNKYGGMVIGTGDLSELALGWCTYNGDHMSMYAVNAGVPKTLIRSLVAFCAEKEEKEEVRTALFDIIDTPISPELIPADEQGEIAQKTEDLVGPYELHDFFLYYFLRYGFRPAKIFYLACIAFQGKFTDDIIKQWLATFFRRFFSQQFKRSCLPDGPKIGSVSLSPRGDWRMPSDASSTIWLAEIENL